MAAGTFDKPGMPYGPCDDVASCGHTDCRAIVLQAGSACRLCSKAIGYETRYYLDTDGIVHAICWEDRER